MVVFGLILVLLAVGAAAFAVWVASAGVQQAAADGSTALAVNVWGNTLEIKPLMLVLLGAAAILVGLFGLWIMFAASRRKYRAGRERRQLQKKQKAQEKELAETRRRLDEDSTSGRQETVATTARDRDVDDRHTDRTELRREDHRVDGRVDGADGRGASRVEETDRSGGRLDPRDGDVR